MGPGTCSAFTMTLGKLLMALYFDVPYQSHEVPPLEG